MRFVLVTGTFDDIRSADVRFLQEASRLGSVAVLLPTDRAIERASGAPPRFPEAERAYILRAVRYVSEVRIVDEAPAPGAPSTSWGFGGATWVIRPGEDTPEVRSRCGRGGPDLRVLDPADVAGFPDPEPARPDLPDRPGVIVTGCFDWLHSGHIRFFEEGAALGLLTVVVGHDANIRLLKGDGHPLFRQEERRYMVGSIRCVHQALISTGSGWMDAEPEIERIRPAIYLVNEDGDRPEKREFCREHGLRYVVHTRFPSPGLPRRQSTELRGF